MVLGLEEKVPPLRHTEQFLWGLSKRAAGRPEAWRVKPATLGYRLREISLSLSQQPTRLFPSDATP